MSAPRREKSRSQADVARGRALVVGACVAFGVTAVGSVALASRSARALGPLSAPHVRAGVTCESCHAPGDDNKITCGNCHDPKLHVSTRSGHRALTQKGALTCATCHPAHGDAYGVVFGKDGNAAIFHADQKTAFTPKINAPKGVTVPLVSLDRCKSCHSLTTSSDPIARCVDKSGFSKCWDEHDALFTPRANTGACGAQHGPNRYVAWDAAAASLSESVPAAARTQNATGMFGAASFGVFAGALAYLFTQRKRANAAVSQSALLPAKKRLPVIDPTTCLGCNACIDACPFDVIEMDRYVAKVARPSDCCGVILCAQVCPNESLTIMESDAPPRGPRIDEHGESLDIPGLFIAGDLTGLPLIKNAIAQGVRVIDRVAARTKEKKDRSANVDVDVVVIGAGPAGLSAALSAQEKKLSCVLIEQGEVAASIRAFPREKLVYDAPLTMPVEGPLEFRAATKEELVVTWERLVRKHAIDVKPRTRVVEVLRDGAIFQVLCEDAGAARRSVRARAVVFATGKYGTPRPFEAEVMPGARANVHRFLADARSFEGKRVIVVGLGDAAMEAAVALSKQVGARVTIVHRGRDFARGRKRNIDEVKHLVDAGSLALRLGHRVTRVSMGIAEIAPVDDLAQGSTEAMEADAVIVLIGGEPSWGLLERAGIVIAR